jgi:glycosyltransferase involved in cell wall biosynthesis
VFALGNVDSRLRHRRIDHAVIGSAENFRRWFLLVWLRLVIGLLVFRPTHVEIHNIPVGLPVFLFWRATYFFHGPAGMEAELEGRSRSVVIFRHTLEVVAVALSRKVCVVSKAFMSLFQELHPKAATSKKPLVRYPKLLLSPICEPDAMQTTPEVHQMTLVCVRRLVKRTGVKELVLAYCQAVQSGDLPSDTVLHVIGQGPEIESIRAVIQGSEVRVDVRLHGRLTNHERAQMYRGADWNIVPTQGLEGFGLVVVESALEGCPSLVTHVGALPEVIEKLGGPGQICLPNVDAMSKALGTLSKISTQERQRLSQMARKQFGVKERIGFGECVFHR